MKVLSINVVWAFVGSLRQENTLAFELQSLIASHQSRGYTSCPPFRGRISRRCHDHQTTRLDSSGESGRCRHSNSNDDNYNSLGYLDHRRGSPDSKNGQKLFELLLSFSGWPLVKFILHSLLIAILLVSWEDLTCHTALLSRKHRIEYLSSYSSPSKGDNNDDDNNNSNYYHWWGQATVRGMGFGYDERRMLLLAAATDTNRQDKNENGDDSILSFLPSYNEVLKFHRTVRVPIWRHDRSMSMSLEERDDSNHYEYYSNAIHTLCQCLASVFVLKQDVENYQWETVRLTFQQSPWTELEWAAGRLRPLDHAIGFDWGSCAWRGGHDVSSSSCNALADAQESVDELTFLTGVLEPYEALFCLDIIERSLRDMLELVPWQDYGQDVDVKFWKEQVPLYRPHRIFDPELEQQAAAEGQEESAPNEHIDNEYLQALQSLRVE